MITGTQVRMARAALRWKVAELAKRAGVAPNTVVRIESGERVNHSTLDVVVRALERGGVRFEGVSVSPPEEIAA
jgi:transcriptional regulator with XRE-family HTH domain